MDDKEIKNLGVIKNDIEYIKKDMSDMKISLTAVLEKYVHREEMVSRFDRLQVELDKRLEGANDRIDEKVNIEDLKPFKNIFWTITTTMFASAILGGLYVGTKL